MFILTFLIYLLSLVHNSQTLHTLFSLMRIPLVFLARSFQKAFLPLKIVLIYLAVLLCLAIQKTEIKEQFVSGDFPLLTLNESFISHEIKPLNLKFTTQSTQIYIKRYTAVFDFSFWSHCDFIFFFDQSLKLSRSLVCTSFVFTSIL